MLILGDRRPTGIDWQQAGKLEVGDEKSLWLSYLHLNGWLVIPTGSQGKIRRWGHLVPFRDKPDTHVTLVRMVQRRQAEAQS
jgi:hypothetical protein